jgi:hypothetical protein
VGKRDLLHDVVTFASSTDSLVLHLLPFDVPLLPHDFVHSFAQAPALICICKVVELGQRKIASRS